MPSIEQLSRYLFSSGIARALVKDVPSLLGGEDIVASPDSLTKVIEVMPESGREILFMDDIWDFSEFFKLMSSFKHVLNFKRFPGEVRDAAKEYVLLLMERGNKIRTIHSKLNQLCLVLERALKEAGVNDVRLLTSQDYNGITEAYSPVQKVATTDILIDFYSFTSHIGLMHAVNIQDLREQRVKAADLSKYDKYHHHPDIPQAYFNILIKAYDRIMRDGKYSFTERMGAGIILVQSQLGLRTSELCILRTDALRYYHCADGKVRPYIVYQSLKAARGSNEAVDVETVCTPLLKKTFKYMLELRNQGRFAEISPFLFRLNEDIPGGNHLPHSTMRLLDIHKRLVAAYVPEAKCRWTGLSYSIPPFGKYRCSIPTPHSFRVHFAVSMYQQGVPLTYVESMLAHSLESNCYDAYYGSIKAPQAKGFAATDIASHPYADELDDYLNELIDDDD